MPFPNESYDPEGLAILTRAFEAAWQDVQAAKDGRSETSLVTARKKLALSIMDAAQNGERDPERLKALAVSAVDARGFG